MPKKTLIVGASSNPERYSNKAIHLLREKKHPVLALGRKAGQVFDVPIEPGTPSFQQVDTISLYLNPSRQVDLYDYLLGLKPKRIIFNPGTENDAFKDLAEAAGIEVEYACTLVLLRLGQY